MIYQGQNKEDQIVSGYFRSKYGQEFKGTVLDLGANDGKTLSNSYHFIDKGWSATLVEASEECSKRCSDQHHNNDKVQVLNIGIADRVGKLKFYESGTHLGGDDIALVSTFDKRELKRWENNCKFVEKEIDVVDYATLLDMSTIKSFDFVTMDIEGVETLVLPQMDLSEVKCLCIEYNMKRDLLLFYTKYAEAAGLKEIHRNNENVIFGR